MLDAMRQTKEQMKRSARNDRIERMKLRDSGLADVHV
jgi:hypothetical protein